MKLRNWLLLAVGIILIGIMMDPICIYCDSDDFKEPLTSVQKQCLENLPRYNDNVNAIKIMDKDSYARLGDYYKILDPICDCTGGIAPKGHICPIEELVIQGKVPTDKEIGDQNNDGVIDESDLYIYNTNSHIGVEQVQQNISIFDKFISWLKSILGGLF